MKKTYICLEHGEKHPALCVVEKHMDVVGRLEPTVKTTYEIHALETLPSDMSNIDIREKVKARMQKYIMGDIRFILGHTFINEDMARFFESTSPKPTNMKVTGEQKVRRDSIMIYVPYSELLNQIDELKKQEALIFKADVTQTGFIDDDDCDLALNMALWFASQDTEQVKGKNIPGLL